jgi:hypothetical protein
MQNQNQDMKKLVENLVKQLQANGIEVNAAAILNLSGNKEEGKPNIVPPPLPGQVDMNKVNDILKELRMGGFPSNLSPELDLEKGDGGEKVKCFCPNCYNYDTFESVHQEEGSKFDYGEVKLNGFTFRVKYHLGGDGNENLIIKKDTSVDLSNMGLTELQAELTKSVQDKNFTYSQQILNEIQERKNKN